MENQTKQEQRLRLFKLAGDSRLFDSITTLDDLEAKCQEIEDQLRDEWSQQYKDYDSYTYYLDCRVSDRFEQVFGVKYEDVYRIFNDNQAIKDC